MKCSAFSAFPAKAMSHQPTELSKGAVCVTEVILEGKKICTKNPKNLQKVNALLVVDIHHVGKENRTNQGALPCLCLNVKSSFD